MELRHELEGRFCRGEVRLRTGEWHSILGETYWKRDAVPKLEERYQPEIDPAYDPEDPYCYGGKLFFGEDVHRQINLGERVVETKMDCGCRATEAMANEEDRRYAILHWLTHRSVNAELLELDGEYSRVLSEQQRAECSAAIDHILNRMSCQDSAHTEFHVHPWLSPDVGCRRPWLEALRNILKDWEGFLEWDPRGNWGPLHKVDFAELSDLDYRTVELAIL
jgi:hypothetical protein